MKIFNKKANKGITLIALVITIIVLLILAGVTISTLTGENGILTQANKSKEKTNEGEDIENIKLAINESKILQSEQEDKTEEALLKETIGKNTNKDVGISKKDENGSYTVTIGNKEYLVQGGNVTSKEDGITDKQNVLVASTDNIIFTNTITEQDVKVDYPNYNNYQIIGISASEAGEYKTSGEIEGTAGNMEIVGDLQQSTYKYNLNKPMLGDETFFVKVSVDGVEKLQKLEVIQGDIVRYEEDKLTFIDLEDGTAEDGLWTDVENENFSNGKAKRVQRTNRVKGSAQCNFSFKGTGIDIIFAQDKGETGAIRMKIPDSNLSTIFVLDSLSSENQYNIKYQNIRNLDENVMHNQEASVGYSSVFDIFKTGRSIVYIDAIDVYR